MNKVRMKNKIQRKKFFASFGVGLIGITLFNSFPFNLFNNKTAGRIKVQPNPYAVNRKKVGGKNA